MKGSDKPITGYALYNEEAKKRTKQNPLETLFPSLPEEKYDIIYADPPWDYNGKMQFDKSSVCKEKLDLSRNIFISSAEFKYPTLTLAELMQLPMSRIMKEDCLLFMWSTNPHLEQAIKLGNVWGFEYKTVAFIWNKCKHNPGQYTLSNCELCLVFKHGRIPRPRGARNIPQLMSIPRTAHSEKPMEIRNNITAMFPTQQKIELFARKSTPGWASWGLDISRYTPDTFELESC